MFSRLIIAVLTLGLLLAFCGTAISSDSNGPVRTGLSKIDHSSNSVGLFTPTLINNETEELNKPLAEEKVLSAPTAVLPPQYFCDFIDYSNGDAYSYYVLPDADYPIENYVGRITPAEGYYCTLLSVCIGVYGPGHIGTPSMYALLYDANRNPIDSVLVDWADISAAGFGYVCADFSTANGGNPYVFTDGEEFHIGLSVVSDGDDTLAFLASDVDTDTEDRYSFRLWDDWYGWNSNRAYLFGADICYGIIPYTECHTVEYDCGISSWYGLVVDGPNFEAMKFSVSGPETLMSVGCALYTASANVGTPDLEMYVLGVDGSGYPDFTQEYAHETILNADIKYLYDTDEVNVIDLSSYNLVFTGDFCVVWAASGASGDMLPLLGDGGSGCGTGRGFAFYDGTWYPNSDFWTSGDANYIVWADLCKDEFASCKTLKDYCSMSWIYPLPDRYGDIGAYQLFSPSGIGCRIEKARIMLDYFSYDTPGVDAYTYNSEFQIYATDGGSGLPGTKLLDLTVTPADYVLWPGWYEVDFGTAFPDPFLFDEDVWVGIESFAPDTLTGIRVDIDDGECGDYRSAENWAGYFGYIADDWSGWDFNWVMELDVCCVPLKERDCELVTNEDWWTMGKDFSRSHASYNSLGDDPQGELTKAWEYVADQVMFHASPAIYKDTVVGYFLNNLTAIDINTGAEIWKRTVDGFEIGSGVYCTPTIYNFADYGMDATVVFASGGDSKAFSAFNLTDGTTLWTRNFMDHSNHFTTFGVCGIMDIAGEPILAYTDDDGYLYAVNAMTGALYSGWATNPVSLGAPVAMGLTVHDAMIYIGVDRTASNGNVYAIDGTTGNIVWDLASSGGLQLANMSPENAGNEGFLGAIAYDVNEDEVPVLYATAYHDVPNTPPDAPEYIGWGILYAINATDGSLLWANWCNEAEHAGVTVDASTVIEVSWPRWYRRIASPLRGPTAYNKLTGAIVWTDVGNNPEEDWWGMTGILSCEIDKQDWYVTNTNQNFVNFQRSDDGAVMFHRRYAGTVQSGQSNSMAMDDGHLLVVYRNRLICLTPQAPRPRLDVREYDLSAAVEFGAPDHYQVVFEDVIGNMGGAPLTVNGINLLDSDNGTIPDPPGVSLLIGDVDRVNKFDKFAEKFANNASMFQREDMTTALTTEDASTDARSNAAFAIPSWVYGVLSPAPGTVIPPQGSYNDSSNYVDIVLDIDGTQVTRGAVEMFAEIDTDDPDYFLDSALIDGTDYKKPMVRLLLVGGCLETSTELTFGVGGANYWTVFNSSTIADGDITTCEIDGDSESFWQGTYIFAAENLATTVPSNKPADIFSGRVYWNTRDWGYGQEFESILADPNCYDATCAPNHRTNVLLGEISNDMGATYEPIYGEVVAYAFVDSAQDYCVYDTLGNCTSWDWTLGVDEVVPYNDTLTAGFHGCCEVIGATDQPQLANFIIHRFEFSGRYNAVSNIYVGAVIDFDISPTYDIDIAGYDASHSVAWDYECEDRSKGWGMVKIPFGCGFDPMLSAKSLAAGQSTWEDTAYHYLDSIYSWLSTNTGLSHQAGIDPVTCSVDPDDRDAFFGIANIDMPYHENGSTTLGVALFGLPDVADAGDPTTYYELANTANKWCGFGRGDVNNDGKIDLADIAFMIDYVYYGGNGPYPFQHLGDVNVDGVIDGADITYMVDYYFNFGACITGEWTLGGFEGP